MAIQEGCSALTCIHSLRGDSRSAALLGLITQLMLSECDLSKPASLKFPFAFILVGTIVALWRWLHNKQWEVLMRTHPLLRNPRHRAMITPGNPVRTRLFHISPSYWTICRSFEVILEWGASIGLEFKCCMQIHCFKKTFSLIWINFKEMLNRFAEGSSGSNGWARVKRERTYSWEPLLRKIFFIYVTCKMNTEVQQETKIYEHWQDPMEKARVNNFDQWSGCWHKCAKQASSRSTGVFRKAAQSLVRPWALILGGRSYGANISVEYYLYLFPYTVRPTLYRVWKLFRYLCPRSRLYCAPLWHTM